MRQLLGFLSVCACLVLAAAPANAWPHYPHLVPVGRTSVVTTTSAAYYPTTSAAFYPSTSAAFYPTTGAAFATTPGLAGASSGCFGGSAGMAGVAYVPVTVAPQQSAAGTQAAASQPSAALDPIRLFETVVPLIERLLDLKGRSDSGLDSSLRRRLADLDDRIDSLDRRIDRLERELKLKPSSSDGTTPRLPLDHPGGTFTRPGAAAEAPAADLSSMAGAVDHYLDVIEDAYAKLLEDYNKKTDAQKKTARGERDKKSLEDMKKFLADHNRKVD